MGQLSMRGANTEAELSSAEAAAAVAREMAKARLLDPQVSAAVASELGSAVRGDLAASMTKKATDELAESVSLEAAHSARQALIPAAVGEAMHTASNQIIQSNLATDVQVAMAAT